MNPWLSPWMGLYKWPLSDKWPLSGNVTQDISPVSSWLSPQFEFNFAGNRQIESEVVTDVASYGKQLGLLAEAVLEIAEGEKGDAVDKLQALMDQVEAVKRRHEESLESRVRSDIERLKQSDPERLRSLLDEYKSL